jgi:hypothetical protein
MSEPVNVKGPGAEQAQQLMEGHHTFELIEDNSDGHLTGPLDKRTYVVNALSGQDALRLKDDWLKSSGQIVPEDKRSSAASRSVQGHLDTHLPTLGGAAGGYVGGIPGAALGRAVGQGAAEIARSVNIPEQSRSLPAAAGEVGMQAAEGAAAEYVTGVLANRYPWMQAPVRSAAQRLVRGPGFQLNSQEERMLAPTGAFEQGAAETGVAAFPRPETFAQPGFFKSFSGWVKDALGAAGRSERHAQQVLTNLHAQTTLVARQLTRAEDPRDMARALNELAGQKDVYGRYREGEGMRAVRDYARGLYQATDADVLAAGGGGITTTPIIARLNATPTLGGQRLNVMSELEAAIQTKYEGRPQGPTNRTSNFERTSENTAPGVTERTQQQTTESASPRVRQATEVTGESTTVRVPNNPQTQMGGGAITTGSTTTTTESEVLPLRGRLQTQDANGNFMNEIPLGEAMELRAMVRAVGRDAGKANNPALQNAADTLDGSLTTQINQQLNQLNQGTPAAQTFAQRYRQAEEFYGGKYWGTVRKEILVKTLDDLADNPYEFRRYFWGTGGLDRLDDLKRSLRVIDQVDVPSFGGTVSGTRFWDERIQPALRYQTIEQASTAASVQNLPAALQGNRTIRELADRGELGQLVPGKLTELAAAQGPQKFQTMIGSPQLAQQLLDLDAAYVKAQGGAGGVGSLFILMTQTGGASRLSGSMGTLAGAGLGAAYAGAQGSLLSTAILSAGGGGAILIAPAVINAMVTNPGRFRNMIIAAGAPQGSPILLRAATQYATTAVDALTRQPIRRLSGLNQPPPTREETVPLPTAP